MKKFIRKHFIRDLFNHNKTLNLFEWIQFESVRIFMKCISIDIFNPNNTIEVFIDNIEDADIFIKVIKESKLSKLCFVIIRPFNIEVYKHIIDAKIEEKHKIYIDFDTNYEKVNDNTVKVVRMSFDNYIEKINQIIDDYNNSNVIRFNLEFDYDSFDDMTLKQSNLFKFWIYQLRFWQTRSNNNPKGSFNLVNDVKFFKKIFVSNDLKLYLNERRQGWSFDLEKHLKNTGETLHFTELNNLRKYMDLKKEMMISERKITNWCLVDFSQNNYLVEIPILTELVDRWLYDSKA